MRTGFALAVAGVLALAAPAFADTMPYFGATPNNGSYWNGPGHPYQPEDAYPYQSQDARSAFGRGTCHWTRTTVPTATGMTTHRRRICR